MIKYLVKVHTEHSPGEGEVHFYVLDNAGVRIAEADSLENANTLARSLNSKSEILKRWLEVRADKYNHFKKDM